LIGKPNIRKAVVAGQFYPSSANALKTQIEGFIDRDVDKSDYIACLLPHAGYMYSGEVAAKTVSRINIKDKVILLGPNHTGFGQPYSIMTEGKWQTPLGEVKINEELAKYMLGHCDYLEDDALAHVSEHSLEVELPFLQYFKSDFTIVPIAVFSDDLTALKEIGKDIAQSVKDLGITASTLIVASSDMTHYESQEQAKEKDKHAVEAILELDADKLMESVRRQKISMCGLAPAVIMLSAAKQLGAKKGQLVKYQTSGDTTGNYVSVVGYAGIIIS
jgi:AmmeMemoRadiSam system protein B